MIYHDGEPCELVGYCGKHPRRGAAPAMRFNVVRVRYPDGSEDFAYGGNLTATADSSIDGAIDDAPEWNGDRSDLETWLA